MMKPNLYLVALLLISTFFVGCNSNFNYEKLENSLFVYGDSLTTEITVVDEAIFHIRKELKNTEVKQLPDYVTILKPKKIKWNVKEENENLIIETAKVKTVINKKGEISYYSIDGKELLNELSENTYINPDSTAYYKVAQSFKAKDEGLYGLGQFQSGRMNWKNVPVRLEQFNQEIANPVLISTNQYGLYWHNYSVTDFNIPKNEIEFKGVVDEKRTIRKTKFTPKKSGKYNFFVLSETPFKFKKKGNSNRWKGEVMLKVNNDTIINYTTIWIPDSFSGDIDLEAGKEYDITFINTAEQTKAKVLFNEPDFNKTSFSSKQGKAIDYYFIHGKTPVEILAEYSKLTGKTPLFEKKTYGFWQCRENQVPTQEYLLKIANEYRKRKIPVDNIVQDWNYWPEGTKGPEWDRTRFPNPKQMVDELNKLNLNLLVSVWPTIYNKPLCDRYDLEDYKLKPTGFIDFYDTTTHKKYYKMLSDSMFHFGVKSIWLDGSEPTQHPNPRYKTPVGEFRELANAYSLLVTKAMYEGRREEFPNERVFNFTRSAFAGQQRYGNCVWSGDVDGSWEQFAEQIPAGINFTMTGHTYWATDIGGFFRGKPGEKKDYKDQYTNPEFRELLTRWFQFGTFTPLFRIHGFKTETEIWNFGQEFENTARKFIDIRYQLMPYIYSEAWQVTKNGKLLMSPLPYYFPEDKNTWNIKDQFMFGKSLLVCPVTEYKARERAVYLPKGEWFDFWTNKRISGGKTITASAKLNSLPLFIKAGSIIPTGPKVQFATQETKEPIVLKVYPGKDAEYTLYLDDFKSYDYENGNYSEIKIVYSESAKTVTIEQGTGNYIDFSKKPQEFVVEVIGMNSKSEIKFTGSKKQINIITN